MILANGGLSAHRYTPQVTPRWPRGSEPASLADLDHWVGRLTACSYCSDELLFWLVAKLPQEL